MMEITAKTFSGADRNEKIKEAIEAGYDKDYVTRCVYEQQDNREKENKLKKEECKKVVYKIAFEVYKNNLKAAGCIVN